MTTATAAPDAAAPALVSRFGLRRHLALASFWFGGNYHWGVILAVLLPFQVARLVPKSEEGGDLGLVLGLGSFFAMTLPPLVGYWSDRLRTRWGRRRPILVVGNIVNAAGLLLLMTAPSYAALLAAYLVVQIFNNAAGAAFNAVVPDVVPAPEYGKQSGILGAMVQLGYVSGLISFLVFSHFGAPLLTYAGIAVVLLLTMIPTVIAARGEGLKPIQAPSPAGRRAVVPVRLELGPVAFDLKLPLGGLIDFLRPLYHGDFAWVIFTRLMITAGIWVVFPFLQYFFKDVAHMAKPADFTDTWLLTVLLAATPFGIAGGWLSDRFGRKIFVYGSGALMSICVLLFVLLYPTQVPFFYVLGIVYGLGYGLYYAVDWALACDTLPDRDNSAKDMGLFHVAYTLPQVLLPSAFGFVLDAFNRQSPNSGYRVVFSSGIVFYLLGTILVSRIKSVR